MGPPMNGFRIRRWCLILAFTAIITLLAAVWWVGGALVAPANRTVGDPPADFPATAVQIESDSGVTLAGWHLPVPKSNATAILLHPIRSDRRSMLSRAKLLRQHGYSTLLIDLQAHGESIGQNITVGHLEKHDVLAAVEFIRDRDPTQKIAIIGRSLGGAATVFANPDADVIVLESVYPTLAEAVRNRLQMRMGFFHHIVAPLLLVQLNPRLNVALDELRPIAEIQNIRCPVLFASGDCDEHTTISETKRMFDAANEPKALVVFNGAGHVDLLAHDPSKYEKEIVEYMNQIIGKRIRGAE